MSQLRKTDLDLLSEAYQKVANESLLGVHAGMIDTLKNAFIKYLLDHEWSESDEAIQIIGKAKNLEEIIHNGVYTAATDVGQRKGYGSEGIADVAHEIVDTVFAELGLKYDWDTGTASQVQQQ